MTKKYNSVELCNEMQAVDNAVFSDMAMTSDIEKLYLEKLEHETKALAIKRAIKKVESDAKKYGLSDAEKNKAIQPKNTELAREIKAANDCNTKLASAAYQMTDREKNLCIATNYFDNKHLFPFIGDDAARYAQTVERVKKAVSAIIERCKHMDNVAMSEKSKIVWLQIMDKYEYRTLKKALEYMAFGLYAQNIKFNSENVNALFVACLKSTRGTLEMQGDEKIRKALVLIINEKQYGAIQTDDAGKKTTKNKK